MKRVIVSGYFNPLHGCHLNLIEAAADKVFEVGDSEKFDSSTRINQALGRESYRTDALRTIFLILVSNKLALKRFDLRRNVAG